MPGFILLLALALLTSPGAGAAGTCLSPIAEVLTQSEPPVATSEHATPGQRWSKAEQGLKRELELARRDPRAQKAAELLAQLTELERQMDSVGSRGDEVAFKRLDHQVGEKHAEARSALAKVPSSYPRKADLLRAAREMGDVAEDSAFLNEAAFAETRRHERRQARAKRDLAGELQGLTPEETEIAVRFATELEEAGLSSEETRRAVREEKAACGVGR